MKIDDTVDKRGGENMDETIVDQMMNTQTAILQQLKEMTEQTELRFDQIDQRFERMDMRFDQIDQRFERMDMRFDQIEERMDSFESKQDILTEHVGYLIEGQSEIKEQLNTFATKNDLEYFDKKIGEHDRLLFDLKMES